MSKTVCLEDVGKEELRDAVCLYYRSNELYLDGSQKAEDLCDEIQRLEIALHAIQKLENSGANDRDRSTTIIYALKFVRDYTLGELENAQLEAGEI